MKVIAVDDMSAGFKSNVPDGVTFVRGDLKDADFVDRLFKEYKFDYVYHLAAYAAEGLSHFIRTYNYRNNLVATVSLVNAAVKSGTVKCFVFTSSIAVYGAGQVPFDESTVPIPEDPYGVSKVRVRFRPGNIFFSISKQTHILNLAQKITSTPLFSGAGTCT